MRLEIRFDRGALRRWHRALAAHLQSLLPEAAVFLRGVDAPSAGAAAGAGAVAALLALERMVLRRSRETLCDRLDAAQEPPPPPGFVPDVVIDCTAGLAPAEPAGPRMLRPLFDGVPGEDVLLAILLGRRIPEIAIEEPGTGAIVAVGQPSGEAADGLTGAIEAVVSRVTVLLEQVLLSPRQSFDQAPPRRPAPAHAGRLVHYALRNFAMNGARAIFHLCAYSPHWRIGWRFNDGPGVFERHDLGGQPWQVLADPGHRFFADPFPIVWNAKRYVFFEDLDHRVGKGIISAIEFGDDGPRGQAIPVLEEPWHMSYPFMVEHAGALWMVPESSLSGTIPLYRCIDFPHRWERAGTLLEGIEAADCTIFRHAQRFWMMSATRPGLGGYSDILRIHHAPDLLGPWEELAQRPALVDVGAARPAGAVIQRHGTLWRPIQDCRKGYGRALGLARIDRLDPDGFAQTVMAHLEPGPLWPGKRLHTLNRAGRLECIDGSSYNPKWAALRGMAEARQRPAAIGTGSALDPSKAGGL